MGQTATVGHGYWLRATPTLSGNGVRVVDTPEQVQIVQTRGQFTLVNDDGLRYFVATKGLTPVLISPSVAPVDPIDPIETDSPSVAPVVAPLVAPIPTAPTTGQVFNALSAGSPVRSRPGTRNSVIIGTVDPKAVLTYVGSENDADGDLWYKVKYPGGQGYIYSGRVRPDDDSSTEAGGCANGNCPKPQPTNLHQNKIIAQTVSHDAKGFQLPGSFGPLCSNFINKNGLGTWGKLMLSAVDRIDKDKKCFYGRHTFDSICPGYSGLSLPQKRSFIALLFAGIAQNEAWTARSGGCYPKTASPGINDEAVGLFQLENSYRQRRAAGRDSRWCKTSGPVDGFNLTFQSECAVSTIEDSICGYGVKINSPDGYWQNLRNRRSVFRNVQQTARRWGLCR